jgi:ATP-dependent DNA helicase Q4
MDFEFFFRICFTYTTYFSADGKMKRSAISVHYDKLGLRVKAPGDLTDIELDEALDALIARTQSQESLCLQQLEFIFSTLNKISTSSIMHCSVLNDDVIKRSEELKNVIREYFQSDSPLKNIDISFQVCFSIGKFVYKSLL